MAVMMKTLCALAVLSAVVIAEEVSEVSEEVSVDTKVVALDVDTFEHLTQASTGMTTGDWFVKFYAPWCGHCKSMNPDWIKLAESQHQKINVAEVDCTEQQQICARFEVQGYPTLIYLKNGKMQQFAGARSFGPLTEFCDTRGLDEEEWKEIPASSTFKAKMEQSMIDRIQEMKEKYPTAISMIEDFVASDKVTSDPMINAVIAGLVIGGALLAFCLLTMCFVDACSGKSGGSRQAVMKPKRLAKDKDSDDESDDTTAAKTTPGKLRQRTKATTD